MPIRIKFFSSAFGAAGSQVVYGSLLLCCMTYAQADQVTLAWDPNTESNLSGYEICYSEASGDCKASGNDNITYVDAGKNTTYTVKDLQKGKTYYFVVRAYGLDDDGSLIQSDFSNEVSKTIPYSIWATEVTPEIGADPDTRPIELGVKFTADVDGFITGIRFYKDEANTGPHIGTLWSSKGIALAQATFTNETDSGWQQVNFSKPVAIKANKVYVASYHTSTGHYYASDYVFATSGVDNPPLHALKDGVAGRNGVYSYDITSGFSRYINFPKEGLRSRNYWVDVVFTTQQ